MYNFRKIDKCNMCGSNSHNHKLLGKRFNRSQGIFFKKKINDISTNIYKCTKCNTIFTNPIPYPNSGFKRYEELNYTDMLNFDDKIYEHELLILQKNIKKNKPKFLDIGCGNGYLLNKLNNKNFDVYGIEPVKKYFDICIKEFPYLKNKVENIDIENYNKKINFDIISFNSVLEHLIDPKEQLRSSLDKLEKGGIIHIEVPHSNWLLSKLINFFKRLTLQNNVTNLSPMHPPYHYYEFSKKSFEVNSKIMGYKILYYYIRVSDIELKIPNYLKLFLKTLMKYTNTGKQLIIFLEKL